MEDSNNGNLSKKVIDLKPVNRDLERSINTKFGLYKADEELLQSTARIKSQRDVILERVQKMEDSRDRVSKSVFEKVKRDYALQLETITELLNEKKETLKKEIKDLYLRREKLSVEVNRHKEILEEASFRNVLGEFTITQYQEVESFETKEIEKLESDLAHISQLIRVHEDLFDPEDLGLPPRQKLPPHKAGDVTKTAIRNSRAEEPTRTIAAPTLKSPSVPVPAKQASASPQPKPSALIPPTLPTAVDEIHDPTSTNEFEDLFLDEKSISESLDSLSSTNASIQLNDLLDDNTPRPVRVDGDSITHAKTAADSDSDAAIPEPSESNYFSEEKVSESSLTVRTQPETTEPKAKVATPSVINTEDSISEILHSINLEGEENAAAAATPQAKSPATAANVVKKTEKAVYKLSLIEGEHEIPEFTLKDNTSIGRSPSNDITLKAPKVSRQHAAINMYNDQHIIIDLKSSNGVYVNGTKVDECVLNPGDEVSIGGYKFLFTKE